MQISFTVWIILRYTYKALSYCKTDLQDWCLDKTKDFVETGHKVNFFFKWNLILSTPAS